MLTVEEIAKATRAPLHHVQEAWPLLVEALEEFGIRSHAVELATAATVGTETYEFQSQEERGPAEYFQRYEGRMGNPPGEAGKFKGRGFVQCTGFDNYKKFGEVLNLDLVKDPYLAVQPAVAARILAAYFKVRGVAAEAEKGNWKRTRILVNGGLNGWDRYKSILAKLGVDDGELI